MNFNPGLQPGEIIKNDELMARFGLGKSGGMRRSRRNNCLVIVSDHTRGIYEDRWEGDVLHYTGMGLIGDQSLMYKQNRTLAESNHNGVTVYLFEVFEPKEYFFHGVVKLITEPYQEEQLDDEGKLRKVWIFPVALSNLTEKVIVDYLTIQKKQGDKSKKAKNLSDAKLQQMAQTSGGKPGHRSVSSTVYERNQYISELAKRRANGICQLCECPAPFVDSKGKPYLESHHIQWLSEGGLDTIENTIALCPNCHRKMHVLNRRDDIEKLKNIIEGGLFN